MVALQVSNAMLPLKPFLPASAVLVVIFPIIQTVTSPVLLNVMAPLTKLHYTTIHYTTLHYTTLHYTTLKYITTQQSHYFIISNGGITSVQCHVATQTIPSCISC